MKSLLALVVIIVLLAGALVSGLAYSNSHTYNLVLTVSPINAQGNSVNQYSFFVLAGGKLTSASNIVLPSHTLIRITIFDHASDISPPFLDNANQVSGTQQNQILLFKGVVGTNSPNKLPDFTSGKYVMQVDPSDLTDTFSVSNGINIPIPPSSIVVAYIYFSTPGTYYWGDLCNCGPSMYVSGEMFGTITVV